MGEADARSPRVVAAEAEVEAARGRQRQAGYRYNPTLNVDVENFSGTGPYSGFNGLETTVSVNQRIDVGGRRRARRSEEHTSELQSLMRISYAVFCLKNKKTNETNNTQMLNIHHATT